jgi:hypothetical protein
LKRGDDWVLLGGSVLAGVAILGIIAATDVTAGSA